MRLFRAPAFFLLALAACGPSSDTGRVTPTPASPGKSLEGLVRIEVSPPNATLVVDGATAASSSYTATGTFADGRSEDVTSQVVFTAGTPILASFKGNKLSTGTSMGGHTAILATGGGQTGSTQLTIQLKQRHTDPAAASLPADPATIFTGDATATGTRLPDLVYPNDGVLVPPNLGRLEIHFRPGQGNTLFELAFQSDTLDVRVYTRCTEPMNGGCIYQPDPMVWTWIAESSRGGSMNVKLRATDEAVGPPVLADSTPITIGFAQDNVEGGIYYWTTPKGAADTDSAIMRWDFGSSTQATPQKVVGTSLTGNKCVGCHALSRDGKSLIAASDGSYNANVLLFDLATQTPREPFASTPPNAFTSYNPDASRFVGTFADETQAGWKSYDLNLFDGPTGVFQETIPVGGTEASPSAHPDWSPDGNMIAFTRIGAAALMNMGTTVQGAQSSVRLVRKTGGSWSAPIQLTTPEAGRGSYYPAFSPDGSLLVFNRSACASGIDGADCDMYDDPQAALHLMKPEAGASSIALARANAPGKEDTAAVVESSFPKWAPFVFQRTSEAGSRLMWITMSSDRAYGLRKPEPGFTLIWMVAVAPDQVNGNADPSFPAFALPFQRLDTDNHTAQWTSAVVGNVL